MSEVITETTAPKPLIFGKFTVSQALATLLVVVVAVGGVFTIFIISHDSAGNEDSQANDRNNAETPREPLSLIPGGELGQLGEDELGGAFSSSSTPVNLDDPRILDQHIQLSYLTEDEAAKKLSAKNISQENIRKILAVTRQVAKADKLKKDLQALQKSPKVDKREEESRIRKELEETIRSTPQIKIPQEMATKLHLELPQVNIAPPLPPPSPKSNFSKPVKPEVVQNEDSKNSSEEVKIQARESQEKAHEQNSTNPNGTEKGNQTTAVINSTQTEEPPSPETAQEPPSPETTKESTPTTSTPLVIEEPSEIESPVSFSIIPNAPTPPQQQVQQLTPEPKRMLRAIQPTPLPFDGAIPIEEQQSAPTSSKAIASSPSLINITAPTIEISKPIPFEKDSEEEPILISKHSEEEPKTPPSSLIRKPNELPFTPPKIPSMITKEEHDLAHKTLSFRKKCLLQMENLLQLFCCHQLVQIY